MPRMRTIDKAFEEVKKNDPETNFTKWRLRQMVTRKEIPTYRAGTKYLVNMDLLYDYLARCMQNSEENPTQQTGIRPIY